MNQKMYLVTVERKVTWAFPVFAKDPFDAAEVAKATANQVAPPTPPGTVAPGFTDSGWTCTDAQSVSSPLFPGEGQE
jgi:hypothetical protein